MAKKEGTAPSGSRTARLPRGDAARNDEEERIASGRNRELQVARGGERKLFKGKLRRRFLEYFAATANAKWSADRAGIAYQTVWKHRMSDPRFAEAYDRALEQALARVRAKLVETRIKAEPIEIDGDFDAPELDEIDPQIGLAILREHGWGLSGPSPLGRPRKAMRTPRVASNAEVRAALVKRLEAFGERVWGEGKGNAGAPLPTDGGGRVGVEYPSGTERVESPPPPQPLGPQARPPDGPKGGPNPIKGEGEIG
jgi:hypothetical protein